MTNCSQLDTAASSGIVSCAVQRPLAEIRPGWQAVHRIAFDDVDPVSYPYDEDDMRGLRDEQALALARFVDETSATCSRLVVHCRYGVSRSAGVAKAIADVKGLRFPASYRLHNEFVYRAVRWAIEETIKER